MPVILNAKTAGQKEAKVTLVTSAGTYVIPVTADVMDMPDFKSIVKEGGDLMTFSTNAQHPFIVEDGKAYNKSSQVVDYTPVQSSFKVKFTIPEGKLGYISWKGHLDHTHHIHEITHRVRQRDLLRPFRHTADRREQSA